MRTRWSSLWKSEFLSLPQSSYTFTIGLIPATCVHFAKWNALFVDAIIGLFFILYVTLFAQLLFWILHHRFILCKWPLSVTVLSFSPRMNEMGLSPTENKVYFGQLLGMCDQISFPLGMLLLSTDTKSKLVSKCVKEACITLTSEFHGNATLLRRAQLTILVPCSSVQWFLVLLVQLCKIVYIITTIIQLFFCSSLTWVIQEMWKIWYIPVLQLVLHFLILFTTKPKTSLHLLIISIFYNQTSTLV